MSYPSYTIAVISYIEAHITEKKLNYEKLAQQIGFSWDHIRALFRHDTGCPIARYVQMRKIKRSALDLIHTDQRILDIALHYGFNSHETYTRTFRRITGMTPSEFRRLRPLVGKEELLAGVYGVGLLNKKESRSDIMNNNIYRNNDSTVLYGVPKAGWGEYGGLTPYPICLKAAAAYLGEDVDYPFIMASSNEYQYNGIHIVLTSQNPLTPNKVDVSGFLLPGLFLRVDESIQHKFKACDFKRI